MGIRLSNGSDGDIVQDPSSALPNEKLGSSSPTMWEGSTIASTQSPTIPSSKYRIMTKNKVLKRGRSSFSEEGCLAQEVGWNEETEAQEGNVHSKT